MSISIKSHPAYDAYEALAPDYDAFTAGYAHDAWFQAIHTRAIALGIPGQTALDLACGTGKSTEPLVRAGFEVSACDISPAMIAIAQRRLPELADCFFVADMRALPPVQPVDLVLCLDDAVNYLLGSDDLAAAFGCVSGSLNPGGLFVFDVNTLATYRTTFSQTLIREAPGRFFAWHGNASSEALPGDLVSADVEAFSLTSAGEWRRRSSHHEQRHHPRSSLTAALANAGLECVAVFGQRRGALLEPEAEEISHIKFVYVARRN